MKKKWFETWFDSPYYHILYKSRNVEEAAVFIPRLFERLNIQKNADILDLACGKGRHASVMAQHSGHVIGIDLSENSIEEARREYSEIANLEFERADMRSFVSETKFDAVFNLFTSFGYFDRFDENNAVLDNLVNVLKPDGILVIDFLNSVKIQKELKPEEVKEIDGFKFKIQKKFEDGVIYKRIVINDDPQMEYCEQVQCIDLDMFRSMLGRSGFFIDATFGDYKLNPFDLDHSDRLILVCKLK